ncbi:MAG TPA: guanylate kinase [Isosphaeraceae bacterium]|nr:guanylate kinase [Isosphaeraceae bacterium]
MPKQPRKSDRPRAALQTPARPSAAAPANRAQARATRPGASATRAGEERKVALEPGVWAELPGRLCVVSGPSGVGKSTLARRLLEDPRVKARLSVSATTRDPRSGEEPGVDYHFISTPEFERMRAASELLEWAEVHGHLYGTPCAPLRQSLAEGFCVLLVIDVQGGVQVKERVPGALLVFVDPPSLEALEARLRERGTDDDATIRRRLENARREIQEAKHHYPKHVINKNLDETLDQLVEHLRQHGCGVQNPDA